MAVAALVAGIAALWQPMDNRLSAIEDSVNKHVEKQDHPIWQTQKIRDLVERVTQHNQDGVHPETMSAIARLEEKLSEVETQFRHQDRLIRVLWHKSFDAMLPESTPTN